MNGLLTDLYELTMAAGYSKPARPTRRPHSSSPSAACRRTAITSSPPASAGRRLPPEPELHRRGDRLPPRAAPVPSTSQAASSTTSAASASPAISSPSPKAPRCSPANPSLTIRAPHHRSADPRDLPALRDHLPDPDRHQGGALRGGRRRPARSSSSARAAPTRPKPACSARAPPTSAAAPAPATRWPDSATASP